MPNLGAVAIGAIAGIGFGIIGALPFLAAGVDTSSPGGQSVLILIGIGAQFLGGFIAARVAARDDETHGGLAGLTLFGVVGIIALAAGEDPGVVTLGVGAVMALVMGSLGGLLSRSRRT